MRMQEYAGVFNELPRRKQRGILKVFKSTERPKGRGIRPTLRNKKGASCDLVIYQG